MLLIHPSVEAKLAATREFMNQLDEISFRAGVRPVCRIELEDKLEYLRTYGCRRGVNGEVILQFTAVTFLCPDHYQNCFGFSVMLKPNTEHALSMGTSESSFEGFEQHYVKRSISGGLIWHGPKSVEEYMRNPIQLKDTWGTHT